MRYRCLVYHSWRGKVLEGVELRICPSNTAPHLIELNTWDALGTQKSRPHAWGRLGLSRHGLMSVAVGTVGRVMTWSTPRAPPPL